LQFARNNKPYGLVASGRSSQSYFSIRASPTSKASSLSQGMSVLIRSAPKKNGRVATWTMKGSDMAGLAHVRRHQHKTQDVTAMHHRGTVIVRHIVSLLGIRRLRPYLPFELNWMMRTGSTHLGLSSTAGVEECFLNDQTNWPFFQPGAYLP